MEKTTGEILKEKLFIKQNSAENIDNDTYDKAKQYAKDYMEFLNNAKTERLAVKVAISLAKQNGFTEFVYNKHYKSGDKIYYNNRNKSVILSVIGSDSLNNGVKIAAAHIDSPRLDLKPNPVYEKNDLAFFKTHYYGGIKKYQWTAIPLALYGVVAKSNNELIDVSIGDKDDEPVFCVTDLLPHLASKQMKKPMSEAIEGEALNVLIGSMPFKDDKASEKVKLNILNILYEKYGIIEKDFYKAELMLVPAFNARYIGFDSSLIGGYGQDDRVCSYPSLTAILEQKNPKSTVFAILADKEEVGSMGNTGMKSAAFSNLLSSITAARNEDINQCISNSKCLSADVNAAYDPTYPEVLEANNCAYLNRGTVLTKYTGSRGKSGTSDASCELMQYFIDMFDQNGVWWQSGELGKVDEGGGGTVAQYIANLNIDVVDLGVPVLSMHSPFEIVSIIDLYMTNKAILTFFNEK